MKILITGSAGFIGYHLVLKLLQNGHEVIGLDNINDYYDVNLKYARLNELGIEKEKIANVHFVQSSKFKNHKFIKIDLQDTNNINQLFESEKFDAVCNLAAQAGVRYSLENPHAYINSNVIGFLNILEACRHFGVKNLAYASSSSVYGLNQSQPFKTSDHTDHPVSLYAATKKSSEMMAHTYSHLYGIQTTGLRFFTVYGPWGRPDMAPMLFADAIIHDIPIKVFNHGDMSRDFTYIDDIINGIIKVIENPAKPSAEFNAILPDPSISSAPYRLYNIGNSSPVQLLDFIQTLEKSIGKEVKKIMMDMQAGDVVSTYADTSDLEKEFGYHADINITDGIDKFITWYKQYTANDNTTEVTQ